ncbi:MAG: dienelactone hydrolase family protein [Candidatus Binatia bacterium]|nr:dienelactone hydrolase family protein [Candidatus Binatia bacterium]
MAEVPLKTEELTFVREGETLRGYGAWPPKHDRMPAVVVIHDVHGLFEHYRDIARRFAREGFFAFVVDLYSREGAPKLRTPEEVQGWIQSLDDRRVLGDIEAAAKFLRSRIEVKSNSIGVLGFCLGGQYAFLAACLQKNFSACVSFYGMLRWREKTANKVPDPLEVADQLSCPFLGLYGEEDPLIPREDVKRLEAILKQYGKEYALKIYRGAGHAFFNDTRPEAFRPEAARDAWRRAIEFLQAHLR